MEDSVATRVDNRATRSPQRRIARPAAAAVLVALSVASLGCADLLQRSTKQSTESDVPEGAHLRQRAATKDLSVAGVTFDPKPEKKEQMAGYVDYIFGGMERLRVTATIVNKGNEREIDVPVVARLYKTRSGGLPQEKEEQLAAEKRTTIGSIQPGGRAQVNFIFAGMGQYAQSTHMLMHVSVDRAEGDTNVTNNVSRTYFWSLLGE
ncbi:MAG: hypothetical protein C4521_12475 [Actinobacteria bacterium]|nr:MAG: hypothetical protein C4521_12475 [Actinomycetota bacterium]